ncbi:hypothetical protein TYRP_023191 [Tyrophagus putrescentiae]|nr:hypothetical protein TYRP_023191 [Tyrophagus putrescentiae]
MICQLNVEQNKSSSNVNDFEECLPNELMDVDTGYITPENLTNETKQIDSFDTTVDSNKATPTNNKSLTNLINFFKNLSVNETPPNNELTAFNPINPEFNILLLGGTGTGKSTTINAYANYSNETRNVTAFRYCITELFSRLHRSASENVFFCFTYSRNTFFRAGDGLHMLNNLLNEEFPEANLILKPKINCFFIDNEAYRFLVAKKAGYPYEDDEIKTYNEAWNKSAAQTEQMLSFIVKKNPHNLQSTFKLNMAQNFIAELADPIVQLQKNIYLNICKIERQRENIENGFSTVDNMLNTMQMTVYDLECVKLDSPNTVCASKKCKKINMIDGYRPLLDCKIFNQNGKFSINCNICGCSYEEHMHCQTDYKPVLKKVIDPQKEKELYELMKTNENKENVLNKIIETLNDTSEEYKSEIDTIQKVAACFGYLLNKHSNSSVNQFIEPHLDLLIEEEQKKFTLLSTYSDNLYNMLIGLKECHSSYVKEIEFAAEKGLQLELENIDTIADELQNLKHFGKMFTKLIEKFLKDNVKIQTYNEKIGYSV